jgi:hypothetical protein
MPVAVEMVETSRSSALMFKAMKASYRTTQIASVDEQSTVSGRVSTGLFDSVSSMSARSRPKLRLYGEFAAMNGYRCRSSFLALKILNLFYPFARSKGGIIPIHMPGSIQAAECHSAPF